MGVALRISILGKILLFAWAQSPPSPTTAAASNACAEARTELASAFAVVASLEAQLNVARKMLIERRLAAAQCELNASTAPRNGAPRELTGVSSERIAMAKESQAEVGATVVPNPLPHRPPLGFGSACHIGFLPHRNWLAAAACSGGPPTVATALDGCSTRRGRAGGEKLEASG